MKKQGNGTVDCRQSHRQGRITIPKQVRESLNLRPGDKVRFEIEEDGCARIRAMNRSLDDIVGMLKPYYDGPVVTVEEMNEAIGEAAVERTGRALGPLPRRGGFAPVSR